MALSRLWKEMEFVAPDVCVIGFKGSASKLVVGPNRCKESQASLMIF